jgi:hypothetical protein
MRITCKNLTSVHRIWFLQSCAASRTPRPVGPTAPVPGRGAGYDWPYRGLWKFDWTRLSLLGLLGHGPKPCSRSEGEPRRQSRPSRCTPARKIALAEVKTVARLFSTVTGRSFKFCMWSVLYCRAGSRGRLGGCEQILGASHFYVLIIFNMNEISFFFCCRLNRPNTMCDTGGSAVPFSGAGLCSVWLPTKRRVDGTLELRG